MTARSRVLVAGLLIGSWSCPASAGANPETLSVPAGFDIEIYADDVDGARQMALGDTGIVYVGSRRPGKIHAVIDHNGDQRADEIVEIASGLNLPSGLAYREGDLYVAEVHRVLRFAGIDSNFRDKPEPEVVIDNLPDERSHGWKYLKFGPDGKLYLPVGMPCNICEAEDPRFGTILAFEPDGSEPEFVARGVRNSVGFDFQPGTGALWFTDNGRDYLGDDRPPDELNRVDKRGAHFGFPYIHGGDIPDPEFGKGKDPKDYVAPVWRFGAHVAALGMTFYTGDMFPQTCRQRILVAQHGSWNRSTKVGYRVMMLTVRDNEVIRAEPFVSGWLAKNEAVSGRPVDVMQMPDGSVLISDDQGDAIYRVSYRGERDSEH